MEPSPPSWLIEVGNIVNKHTELVKTVSPLLVETIDLLKDELRIKETPSLNRVQDNLQKIAKSLTGSVTA